VDNVVVVKRRRQGTLIEVREPVEPGEIDPTQGHLPGISSSTSSTPGGEHRDDHHQLAGLVQQDCE
jgi:hypothetical protein